METGLSTSSGGHTHTPRGGDMGMALTLQAGVHSSTCTMARETGRRARTRGTRNACWNASLIHALLRGPRLSFKVEMSFDGTCTIQSGFFSTKSIKLIRIIQSTTFSTISRSKKYEIIYIQTFQIRSKTTDSSILKTVKDMTFNRNRNALIKMVRMDAKI